MLKVEDPVIVKVGSATTERVAIVSRSHNVLYNLDADGLFVPGEQVFLPPSEIFDETFTSDRNDPVYGYMGIGWSPPQVGLDGNIQLFNFSNAANIDCYIYNVSTGQLEKKESLMYYDIRDAQNNSAIRSRWSFVTPYRLGDNQFMYFTGGGDILKVSNLGTTNNIQPMGGTQQNLVPTLSSERVGTVTNATQLKGLTITPIAYEPTTQRASFLTSYLYSTTDDNGVTYTLYVGRDGTEENDDDEASPVFYAINNIDLQQNTYTQSAPRTMDFALPHSRDVAYKRTRVFSGNIGIKADLTTTTPYRVDTSLTPIVNRPCYVVSQSREGVSHLFKGKFPTSAVVGSTNTNNYHRYVTNNARWEEVLQLPSQFERSFYVCSYEKAGGDKQVEWTVTPEGYVEEGTVAPEYEYLRGDRSGLFADLTIKDIYSKFRFTDGDGSPLPDGTWSFKVANTIYDVVRVRCIGTNEYIVYAHPRSRGV